MSPPRVAIVGMGGYAQHHRKALARAVEQGQALHAAHVAPPPDHEPFSDELTALRANGVRVYDSLRQMLAAERGNLDLVCIPTGIPMHRWMTVAVLEAGLDVLVEKPAAGSIQDVDAMIRARDAAGRRAWVGYQHIYRRSTHALKAELLSGRFGRLTRVRGGCCWPRPPAYYERNGWAGQMQAGDTWVLDGPHNNANAHSVNLLCFLAGAAAGTSATPVSLQAELYRAKPIGTADTVSLRAQTGEGVEVFFAASHSVEQQINPTFALDTEAAELILADDGAVTARWRDGRPDEVVVPPDEVQEASSVNGAIARVGGDAGAPVCDLEIARAQTLCACGSFESSPVHVLGEERHTDGPDGTLAVTGMADAVQRAFAEGQLFSELGLDWAEAGDVVDLRGYGYYPTFRVPSV